MVWLFLIAVLVIVIFLFVRGSPIPDSDSYQITQSPTFRESLFFENNPYVIENPDSAEILRSLRSCFWVQSSPASFEDTMLLNRARWLLLQSTEKRVIRLVPPSQHADFIITQNTKGFYDAVEPRADAMDNGSQSKVLAIVLHPGMMLVVPRGWYLNFESGTVQATFYNGYSWTDWKENLKKGLSLMRKTSL